MELDNIEARELRIGNLLSIKEYAPIGSSDNTLKITIEDFKYLEWLERIPLTEEWLLKFGFKKTKNKVDLNGWDDDAIEWVKEHVSIFQNSKGFHYEIYKDSDDYGMFYYVRLVEFVHDLQNLYYVLEKKELE